MLYMLYIVRALTNTFWVIAQFSLNKSSVCSHDESANADTTSRRTPSLEVNDMWHVFRCEHLEVKAVQLVTSKPYLVT